MLQDQKIAALEDLVQTLQQHPAEVTLQRQEELEAMCVQLQRQVGEMETSAATLQVQLRALPAPGCLYLGLSLSSGHRRFLSDYGLQWVGEPMDQEDSESKTVSEDGERDWMTARKFWKPGDSLAPPEVDFDRLLASLKDLSELVVEGDTQVTPVPGGAQLRTLEPIPLKLYRNGIMMFDGPFQPFCDPSTQRCLRDILDGFFPSELQRLYPNGVPFKWGYTASRSNSHSEGKPLRPLEDPSLMPSRRMSLKPSWEGSREAGQQAAPSAGTVETALAAGPLPPSPPQHLGHLDKLQSLQKWPGFPQAS
ncbi:UBX domain-containing protein 11 [Saguinus oedipus]|uniref:UBX domain-containing protein 11 n=1 Tax=Saguinus oedipus TaxID=9490 RepID=A0ABQ9VAJ3_SAGOE|nr:UBX domain-containing protein 11 [Saguinus oedipus]